MRITVLSPAKINLFLAITGRRQDGFHDLVSVAAPLAFGDTLRAEWAPPAEEPATGGHSLACDQPGVPLDESNLILKAARLFDEMLAGARPAGEGQMPESAPCRVRFTLEKRIPMGAGLGGGSSNAVAALRALNALHGQPLGEAALGEAAARLGSDCPLFLPGGPVIMRGRGERVEPLPPAAAERLRGRRLLVFKPAFGVSTPWAYGRMAARGDGYLPAAEAEARLAAWLGDETRPAEDLLYNNMEGVAFAKHLALPALLQRLRLRHGLAAARMSGSGSACFALPGADGEQERGRISAITATIREAWGPQAFSTETTLA